MIKKLSKLQQVNLRDFWEHEAREFTPWLAQQDNLDILSEEIEVDINFIKMEASVGKFNVDILAEEANSGKKIVIENQLESTDHDHLGKIITYASGYNASIIIWIVKDVCEEHQKAIEWLNEHTDEDINFFLIKIELWQIDDSNLAPKFDIVVCPNTWAKTIKQNSSNVELTRMKLLQQEFWAKFKDYVTNINSQFRLQSPRPQHWYNVSAGGGSEWHVALTATRSRIVGCEIYINRNKDLFYFLKERKNIIEQEIGASAEWIEANVAARIKITASYSDIFDQIEQEKCFSWMYSNIVKFKQVFSKYFAEFKQQ